MADPRIADGSEATTPSNSPDRTAGGAYATGRRDTLGPSDSSRRAERTLRKSVETTGTGIHTGERCRVRLGPADAGAGIVLSNGDKSFRLTPACLMPGSRCTTVGDGHWKVMTVEHLLAALAGMRIDNVVVQVDGPEVPILDGSAKEWAALLRSAGSVSLGRPASELHLEEPVAVTLGDSGAVAVPNASLRLTCVTDYAPPVLGVQAATRQIGKSVFERELAPARTFAMYHEVQAILDAGLARGGSLENALIVYDDRFSDELRMPQECLMHKMLDLLGDLAVLGMRLCAHVTVVRPGHAVNARLVGRLAAASAVNRPG